jgi:hypothetical protein
MNFQQIVLIIAIVVLIILLTFIGVTLSKSKYSESWPPMVGACPDYWEDLTGNGESCFNVKKIGKCNIPTLEDKNTMNFNVPPFNTFDLGNCEKLKWANNCQISWDGITSESNALNCATKIQM